MRAAAVEMLKRWHLAFEGDALALLAALDAESNEAVAEAVVKELIRCGKIKPAEVAASVADGVAPGGGCAATPPRRARGGVRTRPC